MGSLVETVDMETGMVHLKAIEELVSGDCVLNPVHGHSPYRVSSVILQSTGGMWQFRRYMGLRADGAQQIHQPIWPSTLPLSSATSEHSIEGCNGLAALVLEDGHFVRIDGVVCLTHQLEYHELPYQKIRIRTQQYTCSIRSPTFLD